MNPKKILIFPSGTEIAFEILNALKYSKFVEIYGGTSVTDHSEFVYKNLITDIPFVHDANFIKCLNKVIERERIDCIYPAHDSVCMFMSKHITEIHAQVIITEHKTVEICRSKAETYNFFAGESFIPETFTSVDAVKKYPVFVKPAIGQGSKGARLIESRHDLEEALCKDASLIICEHLPGMEYTIDCFTDYSGKLRVIKLRDRQRIRAGISVRSEKQEIDHRIKLIADIINQRLKFRGAWFFQVKKNEAGEYRLMEISPRIPGTMGLSRNMGINFPLLTLFDFWGYDVDIIDNGYRILLDRAFYNAYEIDYLYDYVYLDFDDTLVISGKVNTDLIRFLYQASNEGKKIYLLTKHRGDIRRDLRTYKISEDLFDDIFVLSNEQKKTDYIKEKKAVFIDDSFAERKQVYNECGIPVFDVDMVESLIDCRM